MIGQTILHYKILEKLGGGGMGVVYKAEDTKLRSIVALKFLPPELIRNEDAKSRLIREAQALAALDHPNICTVHAIEESPDGRLFICMAYYDGETLKKKLARERLPVQEALEVAVSIAQGLGKAHSEKIVHRDIKPANIMFTHDGTVKILDFGIAKLTDRTRITAEGRTPGTLVYMSPEQLRGDDIDERSDIFSLGVVLYEMLTGQVPFAGEYEEAVLFKIIYHDPEPLTKYRRDVTEELQQVIDKALQKDGTKRYQTISQMKADLQRVMQGKRLHPRLRRYLVVFPAVVVISLVTWWIIDSIRPSIPAQKHLLVLPFTNVGGDPAYQVFCDGLQETLTRKLTQLEQFQSSLWVVPAAQVRAREFDSASEARGVFGVNLLVTGSLQRLGDDFRFTLNLVDAKNQKQLRSSEIGDRMTNVTLLQEEPINKIAEMLKVKLATQALQVLTAGGTSVPRAYEFYLEGCGYLQGGEKEDLDAAFGLFERAVVLDSSYALAYAGLGEAYWRGYDASSNRQWAELALANCNRALELNDRLAPVHVALGLVYNGTGKHEKAVQEFQQALELDPASFAAYGGMARAYEGMERLEAAESMFIKAIELKPDYWVGYQDLGYFYYPLGRYQDAVEQFRRVVDLTPGYYGGYISLGSFYYYLGRMEEAKESWKQSFAIKKSYQSCLNLGTIYYREERYADAARWYEWALEFDQAADDYLVWGNLASAYYWAPGERDKAYEKYQQAIKIAEEERKLDPHNPTVLSFLAGYYADVGDGARSRSLIKQALAVALNNAEVMFRTGHAYEKLGEREKALVWIARALENGYSPDEIQGDPGLREMREDVRYKVLLQNAEGESGR